jgi:hypothetical protein
LDFSCFFFVCFQSALLLAAAKGFAEVVRILIAGGAPTEAVDRLFGKVTDFSPSHGVFGLTFHVETDCADQSR